MRKVLTLLILSLSVCVQSLYAQTQGVNGAGTLSGVVLDEQGVPVAGAGVLVSGTNKGTVTDLDGHFVLKGVSPGTVIDFSMIGYEPQSLSYNGQGNVRIVMREAANLLDDLVVIGYGSQKKFSLAGAVASVDSGDLDRVHVSTTSSMLMGKVAGLSVRQTEGRPGAGATIRVRNFEADPLFIIDGMPVDKGAFDQLGSNDIESISVLKDASASVYGLRAANGVVLVTTKSGRLNQKAKVNVNALYGWQNWTRFPTGVNAYEWQLMKYEGQINQNQKPTLTLEELEKWKAGTEEGYKTFDWYNYIVRRNAPQSEFNVNVSGGGSNTKYYVSASNWNQQAAFRNYTYNRTNIQSNVESKIGKALTIGLNMSARYEKKKNPAVAGSDTDDYWQPRNALQNLLPWETPFANNNSYYINATQVPEANWAGINYDNSGFYQYDLMTFHTLGFAKYDFIFIPGLSAKVTGSYQFANNKIDNFEYKYDAYRYDSVKDTYNPVAVKSAANREKTLKNVYGSMLQATLNYDRIFAEKHHLVALLGMERIMNRTANTFVKSQPGNNFIPVMNTFSEYSGASDSDAVQNRIGYIGRVNYDYDSKYFIEFAGRYDGSYKFSPATRWGFFPSASAAWRISREPFFQNLVNTDWFSEMKLRASYGVVGDDTIISDFLYITGYNMNSSTAVLDGKVVNGIRDAGTATDNVSWIRNKSVNLGADFGFFKNKLYVSLDFFRRDREGLLATDSAIILPQEVGFSLASQNLNADRHQGYEVAVDFSDHVGDFRYDIGVNFSYARRTMISVKNEAFANSYREWKGSQIGRYTYINWGYLTDGVFTSQEEIAACTINMDGKGNTTILPGDYKIVDINGDSRIDEFDQRPMAYRDSESGAPQPIFNGGLNIVLAWKGFDLAADFSFQSGFAYTPNWESKWPYQNSRTLIKATQYDTRWRLSDPSDPESAWIPGTTPASRFDNSRNIYTWLNKLDVWTVNIVAFRLRTLQFGYTLPKKWSSAIGAENVHLFMNAYNLFSLDNLKRFGVDPEIGDRNGMQYPQSRVVNLGFNLTF